MERNRIWLWAGFLVILVTVLLLLFWPGERGLNWFQTYRPDSGQPYGVQVIHELLKDQAGKDRFFIVEDSLKGSLGKWEGTPSSYVFIGEEMWLEPGDEEDLLRFAEAGNTLFLCAWELPVELLGRLLPEYCVDTAYFEPIDYEPDTSVFAKLNHEPWRKDELSLTLYNQEGPLIFDWTYLDSLSFCDSFLDTMEVLGNLNDSMPNFVRITYGKGAVLLHTTPIAFSNFYMKKEKGLEYADRVLAYLPEGPIYWDRYSDYESYYRRGWGRRPARTQRTLSNDSPLQYILSQPPLAWAWYVGLSMALLFLLFRAKRRQRIIPVLEPNTNTSMEFVATIGQLYFQQNNHRKLALQKWRLFLAYIRDRYHLPTKELDEAFIKKLAERSGVADSALRPMFRLAHNIERSEVFLSENTLIDLHKMLDGFYRNCK